MLIVIISGWCFGEIGLYMFHLFLLLEVLKIFNDEQNDNSKDNIYNNNNNVSINNNEDLNIEFHGDLLEDVLYSFRQ